MIKGNPYFHFKGTSEEAMNFYKSVLGGEFTIFQKYKDIPGGEKMSPEDREKIIHISLNIDGFIIMATDLQESMEQTLVFGNNFHVCLHVESEKEANRIFDKFSKGGKVEMPMNKTPWGSYFGKCRDKFGIQWMIDYAYVQDNNKLSK